MQPNEYFQIFENHHPLKNQNYQTLREARVGLRQLLAQLQQHGETVGYTVQKRLPQLPIRNSFGIYRVYADGTTVKDHYIIVPIKINPYQPVFQ